jgi:7-cyano-7-deazaguanine synthase
MNRVGCSVWLIVMSVKGKCVVVLSGGPDSAVVLFWAKSEGYDVSAISFRYGQIAEKETGVACKIAERLGVPVKVVDLRSLKSVFCGVTSLVDRDIDMTSSFSAPIIVPFRNAIFLSVAVAEAVGVGAEKVFYGAHASDAPFYPDCRREFYESFEKTARLGTDTPIGIEAPFSGISKAELLKVGERLGVPLELTWSCYFDGDVHCGRCESCVNRKKAFAEAKIADPTKYLQ